MQDVKDKLVGLRDSLNEDTFDLINFLVDVHEIDNHELDLYKQFESIIEVDEVADYGFEDDILDFVSTIKNSKYVDIKTIEELNYVDIVEKLNGIIQIL